MVLVRIDAEYHDLVCSRCGPIEWNRGNDMWNEAYDHALDEHQRELDFNRVRVNVSKNQTV